MAATKGAEAYCACTARRRCLQSRAANARPDASVPRLQLRANPPALGAHARPVVRHDRGALRQVRLPRLRRALHVPGAGARAAGALLPGGLLARTGGRATDAEG